MHARPEEASASRDVQQARIQRLEKALEEEQQTLRQERTKYREARLFNHLHADGQLLSANPRLHAKYSSTSIVNPGRIRRQQDLGEFEGDA